MFISICGVVKTQMPVFLASISWNRFIWTSVLIPLKKVIIWCSTLTDIQNTESSAEFTRNGDEIVWNTDDTDVYYKGSTQHVD